MTSELDLRKVPSKLQNILCEINITSLHNDLTKLTRFSNEFVDSYMKTFQMDVNALLKLYDKLRRTKCPSRVEIEYLYQSLQDFKSSLQVTNDKVLKLRSKIHVVVMSSNEEKKRKEVEVKNKQLEITKFTTQITILDSTIKECDEMANKMEIGARELDERAGRLRQQSAQHRENGFLWTVFSTTVGLILTPFTGGASMIAALAAAGIGLKVNYDSKIECDRTATYLRERASDERQKASVQRQRKCELNTEMQRCCNEKRISEENIRELSYTQRALVELKGYLLRSVKCISDATTVVLNLEKALRITELQGETFELLQGIFVDDPTEDFYGETHEEMRNLKERWRELTDMILRFSDPRGIKF